MSSFCQVSANPLRTFESWPWGGLISIYRTAETPLHKVFVPEVRVILWWIVPDSLLVYALCHAMVVLAWKVEFWTVYRYGRFDYVMIIDALLIVRDFAISRGWCWCIPVVVRHVRSTWLASVYIQGSVPVTTLTPQTDSRLTILLHKVRIDINLFDSFDYRLLGSSDHLLGSSLIHKRLPSLKPLHEIRFLMHRIFLLMEARYAVVLVALSLDHEWLLAAKVSPVVKVKIWDMVVLLHGVVSVLESYRAWLGHGVEIHFLYLFDALFFELRTGNDLFANVSHTVLLVGLPLLELDL